MITVEAWQPPGGSFQTINKASDYGGRFLARVPLSQSGSVQIEPSAETAGFVRAALATTQELPI